MAENYESLPPLARRLLEWMWSQRPPMTQTRLAVLLKTGSSTLSNWLNGRNSPDDKNLMALAQITGISYEIWKQDVQDFIPVASAQLLSFIQNDFQKHSERTYTGEEVAQCIRELEAEYRSSQLS